MSKTTGREDFMAGVLNNNPIFGQFLGLCPTLAVTNTVANAVVMAVATAFVLIFSNVIIAAIKKWIPNEVRISAYILVIATFVTIVDLVTAALVPEVYKLIGAFIALIVVNCIILGRAEAFASKNTVWRSFLDGVGNSVGFAGVLLMMASVREVLGNGTFLGINVMGPHFEPWVIMVLPPGGFFTIAMYLFIFGWWKERQLRKRQGARKRGWIHPVAEQVEALEEATA
ncbi:MAG TPA: electron transport complex subunit RsxE [Longimicrobiales bacterium]